jgi:monofunctional biosynthetic peptidoglycan transglycosylase
MTFLATFWGRLLSSEPPLDPARVRSVGFLIADKQDGLFRLEIAWVKAVRTVAP